MIITGIFLEVLAAALGTASKQLIAYAEHANKPVISHLGAVINIGVGPLVDASAYAFAPQVVVAPFACLDVIFNALTAPYTLHWQKETLSRVHIIATGLVAVGAFFTAVFGSVHDDILTVYELEEQLTKTPSLVYLLVEITGILSITVSLQAKTLNPTVRGICLGVIAGVLMGNVFFVKGFIGIVRTSITMSDIAAWSRPTPYLCIACAACGSFTGFLYMRKGLSEYKGIFMVTIFEGSHITAACLSGCIVMSEMAHAPWWQYVLYWVSVLTIVAGIVLINTAAMDSKLGRRLMASSFDTVESNGDDDNVLPLLHGHRRDETDNKISSAVEASRTASLCERLNAKNYLATKGILQKATTALQNVDYSDCNIEAAIGDVPPDKQEPQKAH